MRGIAHMLKAQRAGIGEARRFWRGSQQPEQSQMLNSRRVPFKLFNNFNDPSSHVLEDEPQRYRTPASLLTENFIRVILLNGGPTWHVLLRQQRRIHDELAASREPVAVVSDGFQSRTEQESEQSDRRVS